MRNEKIIRSRTALSPVRRHVGLYAFRKDALRRFCDAPKTELEDLEGLEQLRILETGMSIACVEVDAPTLATSGIDTKADLERVERLIAEHGDFRRGTIQRCLS